MQVAPARAGLLPGSAKAGNSSSSAAWHSRDVEKSPGSASYEEVGDDSPGETSVPDDDDDDDFNVAKAAKFSAYKEKQEKERAKQEQGGVLHGLVHELSFVNEASCWQRNWANIKEFVLSPPPTFEMVLKLILAIILYGSAVFICWYGFKFAIRDRMDDRDVASFAFSDGRARLLQIEVTECVLDVVETSGSGVTIEDASIQPAFTWNEQHVSIVDTGSCLVVACKGPSAYFGYLTAARVKIGEQAKINRTAVVVKTDVRSTVMLNQAQYGDKLMISGSSAIVQIANADLPSTDVRLQHGLVDVKYVRSADFNMTLAAASANIVFHDEPGSGKAVLELIDPNGDSGTASQGSCLSDNTGQAPVLDTSTAGTAKLSFGSGDQISTFRVARGAPTYTAGQVFVSRGVRQMERAADNTLDSTSRAATQVEDGFTYWAKKADTDGKLLLRFRVLGPGVDHMPDVQHMEWLYSHHGEVYLWHPASIFYAGTFTIFAPEAARSEVLLKSSRCIPTGNLPSAGPLVADDFALCNTDEQYSLGMNAKLETHAALWSALPASMKDTSRQHARMYMVQSPPEILGLFNQFSDGYVEAFLAGAPGLPSSVAYISKPGLWTPDVIMGAPVRIFLGILIALLIATPPYVVWLMSRIYSAEKKTMVKLEGKRLWPIISKAAESKSKTSDQSVRDAQVAKRLQKLLQGSMNLLTIIDTTVLARVPNKYFVDGLPMAITLVLVHFTTLQMLLAPLYVWILLSTMTNISLQLGMSVYDMLEGNYGAKNYYAAATLVLLALAQVFLMIYVVISYLARQIDFVLMKWGALKRGRISRHRARLLLIRCSWWFQGWANFYAATLLLCLVPVVIVFSLYVILGACLAPEKLVPVLISIAATIYVATTTYRTFMMLKDKVRQELADVVGKDGAEVLATAIDETLSEYGLTQGQIIFFVIFMTLFFALYLTLIVVGCALFIDASNVVPTLISSGTVVISAAGLVGNYDGSLAADKSLLTTSFQDKITMGHGFVDTQAERIDMADSLALGASKVLSSFSGGGRAKADAEQKEQVVDKDTNQKEQAQEEKV
eukprot:TRINITY_DN4175_c0_g1_i1.p1 TRINITY_DN4175_c0_g1~~TRINITY_DN4175_c0_g1_i1.p1  ORF type:complete len:1065 (-),score=179.51 TRINITY_DN4175_c0_g1_i1:563-3757(-)